MGEEFPATREAASEAIERLRVENGHPAPRLEDTRRHPRRRAITRAERRAGEAATALVEEMDPDGG
jgi:hypothetical protein